MHTWRTHVRMNMYACKYDCVHFRKEDKADEINSFIFSQKTLLSAAFFWPFSGAFPAFNIPDWPILLNK